MHNFTSLRTWMQMQGGPDVEAHAEIKISTESGPKVLILPDGSERVTKNGAHPAGSFEAVLEALATAPEEEPQPGSPDDALVEPSVLDGSISALAAALATGAHDKQLDALEAAERAGKSRKGALEAIADRKAIVSENPA